MIKHSISNSGRLSRECKFDYYQTLRLDAAGYTSASLKGALLKNRAHYQREIPAFAIVTARKIRTRRGWNEIVHAVLCSISATYDWLLVQLTVPLTSEGEGTWAPYANCTLLTFCCCSRDTIHRSKTGSCRSGHLLETEAHLDVAYLRSSRGQWQLNSPAHQSIERQSMTVIDFDSVIDEFAVL